MVVCSVAATVVIVVVTGSVGSVPGLLLPEFFIISRFSIIRSMTFTLLSSFISEFSSCSSVRVSEPARYFCNNTASETVTFSSRFTSPFNVSSAVLLSVRESR